MPAPLAVSVGEAAREFLAQTPARWPLVERGVDALEGIQYPAKWPWLESDFRRQDESDDALFYAEPRLVRHIDAGAIEGLTRWYAEHLPQGPSAAILDVCSSWISHLPPAFSAGRVAGT